MTKRIGLLILSFLVPFGLTAQKQISGYEYWFNENYPDKVRVDITDVQSAEINTSISASILPSGLNILNIRTFDTDDLQSGTLSHFFYKNDEVMAEVIESYQYWLDNDFSNAITVAATSASGFSIGELLNVKLLSDGLHVLNIRFKDNKGFRSSTLSHFFYKTDSKPSGVNNIISCQYWLDNNYANALTKVVNPGQTLVFNDIFNTEDINEGLHILNIRFKDTSGNHSITQGNYFYIKEQVNPAENAITGYRFWLNDDFQSAELVNLTEPVSKYFISENIKFSEIPSGKHSIHFQFRDSNGEWSIVTTDSVNKLAIPVADYAFTVDNRCDSSIVTFTNNSTDGDTYQWDFGDGGTDSSEDPVYIYHQPGEYEVNLRVTNSETGFIDEKKITVIIKGDTYSTLEAEICKSYISPSGRHIWTESGIYKDTIPNSSGCDSIITIDLMIKNADVSVSANAGTLTAGATGASYQWLDCSDDYAELPGATGRSFNAVSTGNFAVEVTQNGCVDTSQCYTITISKVDQLIGSAFKVYPNPTDGQLRVQTGEAFTSISAVLFDSYGRKLKELLFRDVDSFDLFIDGPAGIYLLELYFNDNRTVYRIIKE